MSVVTTMGVHPLTLFFMCRLDAMSLSKKDSALYIEATQHSYTPEKVFAFLYVTFIHQRQINVS